MDCIYKAARITIVRKTVELTWLFPFNNHADRVVGLRKNCNINQIIALTVWSELLQGSGCESGFGSVLVHGQWRAFAQHFNNIVDIVKNPG
jgi:hypothetical protein